MKIDLVEQFNQMIIRLFISKATVAEFLGELEILSSRKVECFYSNSSRSGIIYFSSLSSVETYCTGRAVEEKIFVNFPQNIIELIRFKCFSLRDYGWVDTDHIDLDVYPEEDREGYSILTLTIIFEDTDSIKMKHGKVPTR